MDVARRFRQAGKVDWNFVGGCNGGAVGEEDRDKLLGGLGDCHGVVDHDVCDRGSRFKESEVVVSNG